jgi:hypothetical protein
MPMVLLARGATARRDCPAPFAAPELAREATEKQQPSPGLALHSPNHWILCRKLVPPRGFASERRFAAGAMKAQRSWAISSDLRFRKLGGVELKGSQRVLGIPNLANRVLGGPRRSGRRSGARFPSRPRRHADPSSADRRMAPPYGLLAVGLALCVRCGRDGGDPEYGGAGLAPPERGAFRSGLPPSATRRCRRPFDRATSPDSRALAPLSCSRKKRSSRTCERVQA